MSSQDAGVDELVRWLAEVSGTEWVWFVKYISFNDTYAKPNVHQGGPHLSKAIIKIAFPNLTARAAREANPDLRLPVTIDSSGFAAKVRLVWYNSKQVPGRSNGRDEARLTRWGGKSTPLVEPDATGSLVVFAFHGTPDTDADQLRIWQCRSAAEEDHVLDITGGLEPGAGVVLSPSGRVVIKTTMRGCALSDEQIPPEWKATFPAGEDIVRWVVRERPLHGKSPDERLILRRNCEFEVFQSVENFHVLPRIQTGFSDVGAFVAYANSIVNRRKSRSGRSLELQLRQIFDEAGVRYSANPTTEDKRTPDFIFPSIEEYNSEAWPVERLRMLGVKTTCKDRWRQVLSEAARIPVKHLLTLQEGVSVDQHREMQDSGLVLVVPRSLVKCYPEGVRPSLLSLEAFLKDVAHL